MTRTPRLDGRLVTWRGVLCGALASAASAAAFALHLLASRADPHLGGLFNDFYDYWAAARVLNAGGDPYDLHLVSRVLAGAGVHSTVGGGYSYPLLMAELARPLGLLDPLPAAAVFTAGSLLAIGLGVALLLSPAGRAPAWQTLALAAAAGLFAPVSGTLYFGQVNLYLLPFAALALRGVGRPGMLAVVSAVKLYPVAALAAFGRHGRRGVRPLLLGLGATAGLALGPNLVTGRWSYGASLLRMFRPDPYWSNQSINGWLSRLALPSATTRPPLPWLPVTPVMLLACAGLGAAVLYVALRRADSWPGAFALLLCYGAVAAPKNSLWNLTPLVVAAAYCWPLVAGRPARVAWLALAWALLDGQDAANLLRDQLGPDRAAFTWLSSVPLYGGLLLTGLVARLTAARPAAAALEPAAEARRAA